MSERSAFPGPIEALICQLEKLPGVGRRSAERMAFHVLKSDAEDALKLSAAIETVKKNVRPCGICGNLSHCSPCEICDDQRRDASLVLVVEQTRDLLSIEETGAFSGVYHVLGGKLDPLAGIDEPSLLVDRLVERATHPETNAREQPLREIVLGLSPDLEGDSTALLIAQRLQETGLPVSRLARGLPSGTQLEYASKAVLGDAIRGRQRIGRDEDQ